MFCDMYRSDCILITECHFYTVRFCCRLLLHLIASDIFMTLLVSYYINTINRPLNQLMSAKNILGIF